MPSITDLQQTLNQAQNPLSLKQILATNPKLVRRTTQRWLSQLIKAGKITVEGQGRNRVYSTTAPKKPTDTDNDRYPSYIPLSPDSHDILNYIDQPLAARKPVAYDIGFLEDYQPNKTYYLPAPLRRQLHKMGNTRQTQSPAGTYGRAILNRLLIDLSWASSNLEGNTYSRLDTVELIEHGNEASGKASIETQMILNHKYAIEFLVENVGEAGFNRYTLLNLHAQLAENLLPNPADEGRVRQHIVEIGKSVFRPLSVPGQIEEALTLLLDKASQINDPFEQAFFIMVHIPYLQPFADINKRTSRIAANLPLLRANLCPLTFLDVPEKAYSRAILGVYELGRFELLRNLFIWAYERSTQEYLAIKQDLSEPDPLRLRYGKFIKRTIYEVITQPNANPIDMIKQAATEAIDIEERADVEALVIEELRRLHEGVLSRYGLRPLELKRWKEQHSA